MPVLDRGAIDPDADRVVRRLARHGHKAYLVGGCVRDILLGRRPKDFDVATSATPNEIKQLFRNCRIIGRRFRLAHVFFGHKIIETSTFRANPKDDEDGDLLIRRDNVFGTETEDARRRDFTINGLFYDVEREEVIDHVGGLADLEARVIRTIGDPETRFQEDPVRMLRAIKFAARLDFAIEPATYRALVRWRGEIRKCAPPRVLEEVYRLLRGGAAHRSIEILIETATLEILSPHLSSLYEGAGSPVATNPMLAPSVPARPLEPPDGDGDADADAGDTIELLAADEVVEEDVVPPDVMDAEEAAWHRVWADEHAGGSGTQRMPLRLSFIRDRADLERRRIHAWAVLRQIDGLIAAGRDPSNALVMCALVAPFVVDAIVSPGSRPGDANHAILEIGQPLVDQLRVARRDAERLRQILLALRRIVPARRRRGNLDGLGGRDVVEDGVMLHELLERAGATPAALPPPGEGGPGPAGELDAEADEPADALDASEPSEPGEPGEPGGPGGIDEHGQPRKRRRRRRGGRRRRREDGASLEGASA
jgi:poly(A) polymerase